LLLRRQLAAKRVGWMSCIYQDVKAEGVIYVPGFKISPAPEMKTKKL